MLDVSLTRPLLFLAILASRCVLASVASAYTMARHCRRIAATSTSDRFMMSEIAQEQGVDNCLLVRFNWKFARGLSYNLCARDLTFINCQIERFNTRAGLCIHVDVKLT